ncbi:molecular chaperone DnaJ [Peptoniphilus catoniae]|uniref:molecular chaperone DnaJ n=1 Tax=Peptoniphilus catoniae TaxID=1660341 RepID=UPI0010FDE35E|nr:molecular chaperone DnaJ [Peptoniphilus catoniae]
MRDFYEILEVERSASLKDIKKSYKRLAKKYHPDLNQGDKESEMKFKEINVAYEVLSDEGKRRNYDLYGEEGVGGNYQDSGFGGFSDIFGDIFDMFGGASYRDSSRSRAKDMPRQGSDIRYDISLDFREAVFGTEKEINVRRRETCSECHGDGKEPGTEKHTCDKCGGSGQVQIETSSGFGRFIRVATCDKCGGSGVIIEHPCKKCNGQGKETVTKKIKTKIPAGVDNGTVISMSGEGNAGENGGPNGDLYIYIRVADDSVFKRNGYDLHINMPITYMDAVLGGTIKVPTLTKLKDFEIPKGTQGGTTFRLKDEGIKKVRGSGKGDLYFTVDIIVPKKINEEQEKLLEELRNKSDSAENEEKGFFSRVKDFFE